MKKINIPFSVVSLLLIFVANSCTPYKNLEKLDSMENLDYGLKVSYIELSNDVRLAYVDEGSGDQTIIFIHGLGSYIPAWKRNIQELKNHYRCIAIDLPGYGKSSKLPHSGAMTYYAAVVMEFAQKMGIEKPVLAGHSMGGQISMVASLEYPDLVDKIILVSPAGMERFTEGQKQWFRDVMTTDLTKKTTVEGIHTNLAYNFYNMPKEANFMIEDRIAMRAADDFENYCYIVAQSVSGMVDEPVIDKLQDIHQSALVLFGENDNLIPNRYLNPGYTKNIAISGTEKMPDANLVLIPKCGHFAQFEKYEIVNKEIKDFLK